MTSHKAAWIFLFSVFLMNNPAFAPTSELPRKAMASTADPHATEAALSVLKKGGNAVDAAIAAQWVLNVVEPQSSGIGGGGFFVYYEAATGKVFAFDGRETAPAKAFPEMFLDKSGNPYPFWPERITGGLPVGVPGLLKLLKTVHARFGSNKVSFDKLFAPAIEIAEQGFPLPERVAKTIVKEEARLRLFPDTRKLLFDKNGKPLKAGDRLVQKDLAKTFRTIAAEGIDVFYEGAIGKDLVRAVRKSPFHPGLMTLEDLSRYEVIEREPVHGSYRGYEIWGMSPPSSGGPTVQATLNILENFDWKALSAEDRISLFAQAQRLAFIDRNRYLGDPAAMHFQLSEFISKERAKKLAARIDLKDARKALSEEDSPVAEGTHTSHLSVTDEAGNMVAFTTTIEHLFGSGIVVPGRGFFLNNELTDFDAEPRNKKGDLMPNAPGAGKRPRSSMSPTFVFKDGKPFLVAGSPGGSKIIGTVLNVLVNVIDEGLPLQKAMEKPRMIDRDGPAELEEFSLSEEPHVSETLKARGFEVTTQEAIGNAQAILFREDGVLEGASDPRGIGEAAGY